MTDSYTAARNASSGMPVHSMSADVGVREAGGDKLREALEELRGCMIRHPTATCEVRKEYLEVALEALDAALTPPTESVKAPEGVTQADRDLYYLLRPFSPNHTYKVYGGSLDNSPEALMAAGDRGRVALQRAAGAGLGILATPERLAA